MPSPNPTYNNRGKMKLSLSTLVVTCALLTHFPANADHCEDCKEEPAQYVSPFLSGGVGFYLVITKKMHVGVRRHFESTTFYVAHRSSEFLTIIWNHKPYVDSRAPEDFREIKTKVNGMEMDCRVWEHHIEWQNSTYYSKECNLNLGKGNYKFAGDQYLHFRYYNHDEELKKLAEDVIQSTRRIQNF